MERIYAKTEGIEPVCPLPQVDELVELQLSDFDHLITKKKVDEDDDFDSILSDHTRYDWQAWGENSSSSLPPPASG